MGQDTNAIAERSLKYATLDIKTRARQWRGFCYVHDWRVMRAIIASGGFISDFERMSIMDGLAEHGKCYHRPSTIKALQNSRPFPDDPLNVTWHGMTVRELAAATGDSETYDSKYK